MKNTTTRTIWLPTALMLAGLDCASLGGAAHASGDVQKNIPPETIPLWSGKAPVGDGTFSSETASITIHRPAQPNGAAVVICPGGGYGGLVVEPEGHGIARWLNRHGIVGVVLEYRLPKGNQNVPLLDAQRAIRMVRSKAREWGIDPKRIGIMGFSAGGHLASTAATHFDKGAARAKDPLDRIGCRPDFAILVYPVITMGPITHPGSRNNLLGQNPKADAVELFSNEKQVTSETPPTFLAHAQDDSLVPPENSQMFYDVLRSTHVAATYLKLPSGGHGLNGYSGPMWDEWQATSLEWLGAQNMIPLAETTLSVQELRAMAGADHWAVYTNNPVLRPGAQGEWDAGALGTMSVLKVGELYHLYYEAWGVREAGAAGTSSDYLTLQIGHATSRDGLHWTKDPANPVLPKGADNEWDHDGTWDPFVLHEDGVFKMWYGGGEGSHCDWGYAVSTDGVHFVKKGQLSHLGNVEDDHVVHDSATGRYFMYYWDRKHEPAGLFRAQSPNETDFDFAHAEPIRIEGLKYPAMYKFTHVIQDEGQWHMFFGEFVRPGCKDCRTGHATSPDGLHWTATNAGLIVGQDGEALEVADDLWLMYYGPDGCFDQAACDICVALFKGSLADVAGMPRKAKPESLQAWRDARFGMFIHWGPVSLKGTEISWSRANSNPHCPNNGPIPVEVYDTLYKEFNPTNFNAREWVATAKAAGMKYMVLTAKHCDGFLLWDSKVDDYNIMHTPFKRDVCAELAKAAHDAGMKLGWYFSPMDWRDPDCRSTNNAAFVKRMQAELAELLTNYGTIDLLWFDWDGQPAPWDQETTYRLVRQLQPGIVIDNRLDLGNGHPASFIGPWADYYTPEQEVGGFDNRHPWESCMTISHRNQWAWGGADDGVKTFAECVKMLIGCAGGDGNLLLNVGPMPNGEIAPEQTGRLKEMGAWLATYGTSICGTRGGPYMPDGAVVSTHKGTRIYLHILSWPGETLSLPALPAKILRSTALTGGNVTVTQADGAIEISLPAGDRQESGTIVELELDRPASGIEPLKRTRGNKEN